MRQGPRCSDRGLRPSHRARSCGVHPPGFAVSRPGPRQSSSPDSTRRGSPGGGDVFPRSSVRSTLPGRATHREPGAFPAWIAISCSAGPPFDISCWSAAVLRFGHPRRQLVASINSITLGRESDATDRHEEPKTDRNAVTEAAPGRPESAVLHMFRAGGQARSATRAAARPRSPARARSGRRYRSLHPVPPFAPAHCRPPGTRTSCRTTSRGVRDTADR